MLGPLSKHIMTIYWQIWWWKNQVLCLVLHFLWISKTKQKNSFFTVLECCFHGIRNDWHDSMVSMQKLVSQQSPKNMGNLGTGFLRKVCKSEEGLTRISRINVLKTGGKGYQKRHWDFLTIWANMTSEKILFIWGNLNIYEANLKSVSNIPQCVGQPYAVRKLSPNL